MYLSHLLIDVGADPDRPRPGRKWLNNVYNVHQRLCMAFPSTDRKKDDPQFLAPYNPDDFASLQVHVKRNSDSGFLFRIDPHIGGNVSILVLSAFKPDWDYAFYNANYLLAAPPETKEYIMSFIEGNMYRFRVCVNLSKKSQVHGKESEVKDKFGRRKTQGKRVSLTWDKNENPDEVIREWFSQKCLQKGIEFCELKVVNIGWIFASKHDKKKMKFRSALLEGTLKIINILEFEKTIINGIGSAKAFGFGLLSVKSLKQ